MFSTIAIKEWRMVLRNHAMVAALLSALLLSGIASIGSRITLQEEQREREAANREFRRQWEQLQTNDPHGAAHFGTYIFKPLTALSGFDRGLDPVTGSTLRIEAHIQHHTATPPLSPADVYLRFGELTPATVLQLFFPLLIFFLCFNSYAQERSSGTLRLMMIQGTNKGTIMWSKTIVYQCIVAGTMLLSLLLYLPVIFKAASPLRILLLLMGYLCYSSIFVIIGIWVSAVARNARQALLWLCSIWLIWNVIAPRLTTAAGAALHPLPSQYALQQKIDQAIKTGIDGNDPREARTARLLHETLRQYQVADVSQLPVNFNAIRLQADEDYAQQVYNKYAKATDSIIRLQNSINQYAMLADPYLAIRSLSMALCGTDYDHQFYFDTEVRQYRNTFIHRLNQAMIYDREPPADLYYNMPVFHFEPPAISSTLSRQWLPLASLLLWIGVSISLLNSVARHAPTE
ncbi:DUF3526 domain-containing protein [Chitinophaga flava]|nr:DUF3526 domain-containing protein [Chitinophaga flava]